MIGKLFVGVDTEGFSSTLALMCDNSWDSGTEGKNTSQSEKFIYQKDRFLGFTGVV